MLAKAAQGQKKAPNGGLRRRQAVFARLRQPRAVIKWQRLPQAVIHSIWEG